MMTDERSPTGAGAAPSLEDVLDAYTAEGPGREALETWIARFPQYDAELIEFTLTWFEIERLPEGDLRESVETLDLRGASVLGQVLHELRLRDEAAALVQHFEGEVAAQGFRVADAGYQNADGAKESRVSASAGTPPFPSLMAAAEVHGLTLERLAATTKMSVPVVAALHRRLVILSSIPNEAIVALGRAISHPPEAVRAYLALEPALPELANYKAERAPKLQRQIDFFDLVRTDPELHKSDKSYWLGLERPR